MKRKKLLSDATESLGQDLLDREIFADDFVVFHNNLYRVVGGPNYAYQQRSGMIRIMLVDKSKTTKPVTKYASHCCVLPKGEALVYLLKRDD